MSNLPGSDKNVPVHPEEPPPFIPGRLPPWAPGGLDQTDGDDPADEDEDEPETIN